MIFLFALAVEMSTIRIEGWVCRVEATLIENKSGWKTAEAEIRRQLQNIKSVVPSEKLAQLQTVTFWVREKSPSNPAMAYHPSVEWLRAHSLDPEMAKCIELGNIANFNAWTNHQPWMLMHELAHAYHDQFLADGFGNSDVGAAFDAAKGSKKYESVLGHSGKNVRHYGLNNAMEYFAETTEAYFGKNDFQPFTISELRTFDPQGFALMKKVWGTPVLRKAIKHKA